MVMVMKLSALAVLWKINDDYHDDQHHVGDDNDESDEVG